MKRDTFYSIVTILIVCALALGWAMDISIRLTALEQQDPPPPEVLIVEPCAWQDSDFRGALHDILGLPAPGVRTEARRGALIETD